MDALIKDILLEEGAEMAAAMHEAFKGISILSSRTPNFKFSLEWEKNCRRLLGDKKYKESREKKYPETVKQFREVLIDVESEE